MENKKQKYILWFKEISAKDVALVGGKNASLGEMIRNLTQKGINIPDGFALTTNAYWHFLKFNNLDQKLKKIFERFDPESLKSLQETGKTARNLILRAKFPEDLKGEIIDSYQNLSKEYGPKDIEVAVRSSGVAEDAPTMSFAGQFETYLNISGKENLLKAIRKCLASAFGNRVIAYREEKKVPHLKFALSVGVQKMVRSDVASSGVMFTLDTETGFQNVVLINSIYGVGEMIVKGKITPDEFYVFKPTLKEGFKSIIAKNLGRKTKKYIFAKGGGLKEVKVEEREQRKFSLSDEEVLTLAKWACQIEENYGRPQDIEWAKDGRSGQLFIVQSRPETVFAPRIGKFYEEYKLKTSQKPILTGIAVGTKVSQGKVRVIPDVSQISQFQKGEILVTKMTDPDWVPALRMASAVITDEGGRTCFSGDTNILTNKGFLSLKEIVENFKDEKIKVLSLNRETLKLEWKSVVNGFKRKASLIEIEISQTGRGQGNILKVTPDHKFLIFNKRELVSESIQKILNTKKQILSIVQIPSLFHLSLSPGLAYLLGAISTDGHVYNKKKVQLLFIQSPTKEKEAFIEKVKNEFLREYQYNLHLKHKPPSEGVIRGREIKGKAAIELACYKKGIINDFLEKKKELSRILLSCDEEFLFNFLAGVIDGDGTYNQKSNRINIFCSPKKIFEEIIIACLRLGISFQVTPNRHISNIQIVDKVKEIFNYTCRVSGQYKRERIGSRFFSARQLLSDIIEKINYKGRVRPYMEKNLLIDAEKIRNYLIPLVKGSILNHQLTKIVRSSLKALRVKKKKNLGISEVYNIEVEDNHNYVVFTSRFIPVIVENCHAAIVSRELGVPAVVGTGRATKILKNGQEVTVDCTGKIGNVFLGKIPFEVKRYDLEKIPKLKTKIMVNIGAPEIAFQTSFLPNDGVGLARIEFILAEKIRIHPLALYHYENLKSQILNRKSKSQISNLIKKIDEITFGYKDKKEFFVDELTEGISQIGAAFWPKPVIIRLSDLKTNEYRALIGGELFEPQEENPMLGWRGASRYYDPKFQPAFEMECQAIKKTREVFGLKNIWVMVPFCRTLEEGKKVLELMEKNGLKRGEDGLKVIVMCEIPANVILAEEFLEIFDGMSIGSNDLSQLVLGLDRDSAIVAKVGDERNEAVKRMISRVIKLCNQKKKYCGICGQAPSDYPEFTEFLVKQGIESISLNPDATIKTIFTLAKKPKKN